MWYSQEDLRCETWRVDKHTRGILALLHNWFYLLFQIELNNVCHTVCNYVQLPYVDGKMDDVMFQQILFLFLRNFLLISTYEPAAYTSALLMYDMKGEWMTLTPAMTIRSHCQYDVMLMLWRCHFAHCHFPISITLEKKNKMNNMKIN